MRKTDSAIWFQLNRKMGVRQSHTIWDAVPLSRIEHEIFAVTDWRPKHKEARWKYLISLARMADKVDDHTWETAYCEKTQDWIEETLDRFESELPPIDPNKYAPSIKAVSTSAGKRKKGMSYNIRDIVCDDPDITVSQLKEKLENRGIDPDHKSLPVIHSYTKSAIKHAMRKGLIRSQEDE